MKVLESGKIKAWIEGVPVEEGALNQASLLAGLPFVHKHVALMPDVHAGKGSTVGSVFATHGAIVPAAVGVDIGCGMLAVQTSLTLEDLPDNLSAIRDDIEKQIPLGPGGSRNSSHPYSQLVVPDYPLDDREKLKARLQMGTLGSGNHFIELCFDESGFIWIMLHSGSRGIGNILGTRFISLAKRDMERYYINLPDSDLAYIPEGSPHYEPYIKAVEWAQRYAEYNRLAMRDDLIGILREHFPQMQVFSSQAVNCHHNYVTMENHFGKNVWLTRKGAVRAREGELGIIPGSMGAKSYIVRGKGNKDSFCSCSHGAGRVMSRSAARKTFSLEDHLRDTAGVECRKDLEVIDETPKAYKDIDAVMEAQKDLVEIVHTLKQVLCVKG